VTLTASSAVSGDVWSPPVNPYDARVPAPWLATAVPELSGFTVEWAEPGNYILSRGATLYRTREPKPPFSEVARFPLAPHLRLASRIGLSRRALRLSYYNTVPRNGALFVTFNRSLALLNDEGTVVVTGFDRPFRVLRSGCALTDDGSIWFGEYVIVREAAPLRIYRLPPGSERAEVVHVFPSDFARHIHGVYLDPFDSSLWCLTGDAGSQSHILRSTDGFETSTTIGSGDQTWRAVSAQFRADAIYYATDAWDRQNWIYRIDRASGERTEVAPLDGPVYYSHRVGDDLFFAVAAEGQQPHLSPRATLWHLDSADGCSKVASFDKDVWPVAQFQPGTISFPRGPGEGGGFYFSGVALAGIAGITFRCAPEGEKPA
jgi:hypothetical protein